MEALVRLIRSPTSIQGRTAPRSAEVPPRLFARYGLPVEWRVLTRRGWAGEKSGLFEHPAIFEAVAPSVIFQQCFMCKRGFPQPVRSKAIWSWKWWCRAARRAGAAGKDRSVLENWTWRNLNCEHTRRPNYSRESLEAAGAFMNDSWGLDVIPVGHERVSEALTEKRGAHY